MKAVIFKTPCQPWLILGFTIPLIWFLPRLRHLLVITSETISYLLLRHPTLLFSICAYFCSPALLLLQISIMNRAEAYIEPSRSSWLFLHKSSVVDVLLGSKYTTVQCNKSEWTKLWRPVKQDKWFPEGVHCVKYVQIRSFFRSVFSRIRTEFSIVSIIL